MPALSVIIVTYESAAFIGPCLTALCANGGPDVEIIVVDNGSSDGTPDVVRGLSQLVSLIHFPDNRGFAAGANTGAAAANGRYLLFLNPDTRVEPGAVPTLVSYLEAHPGVAAAGPLFVSPDGAPQDSGFTYPTLLMTWLEFFPHPARLLHTRLNGRLHSPDGGPIAVDHPLGACILVRRAAWEDVGPFDEGFFLYCEEVDWCMRARARGWTIASVPTARVVHHGGMSAAAARAESLVHLYQSRRRLHRKYRGLPSRAAATFITVLGLWRERRRLARLRSQASAPDGDLDARLAGIERALRRGVRGWGLGVGESKTPQSLCPNPQSPAVIPAPDPRPPTPITDSPTPNPQPPAPITACVIARDEARNLAELLPLLRWADEVLVLGDDATTDDSAAVARRLADRVVVTPFRSFADFRNTAIQTANGPWVLFVDADERVSPELAAEVRQAVGRSQAALAAGDEAAPVGYWIPRRNFVLGRVLRGGGWAPDEQLRLLRGDRARYDEAQPVHEVAVLEGPTGRLAQPLVHFNYSSIRQFWAKQRRYTEMEAEALRAQGIAPRWRSLIGAPVREFWRRYVSLGGRRDGSVGLFLALSLGYWAFQRTRLARRR